MCMPLGTDKENLGWVGRFVHIDYCILVNSLHGAYTLYSYKLYTALHIQ